MSDYSLGIPSSFDPALLHSELATLQDDQTSHTYSDETSALQQYIAEKAAAKNTAGIVIQYRAWNTTEVFRSEGEEFFGNTSAELLIVAGTNIRRHTCQKTETVAS